MTRAPSRVLIIRQSALGDVLLATPLLRALRQAWPRTEIDWLVSSELGALLESNPHLTRVQHSGEPGLLRKLRKRRYELVIDLQNKPRTALLRSLLGAETVRALIKRDLRQTWRSLLGRENPPRGPHAVDLNLSISRGLGIPDAGHQLELRLPKSAHAEVASLLDRKPPRLWGFAPGSRWATKRWPTDHFAELAHRAARQEARVLLLGGPGDATILDELRARLGDLVWADTRSTSVGGLAALIAACDRVFSNDSGPAHIAAALGRPVTVLFGPTSPERWAPPLSTPVSLRLECSPCSNHGGRHCPLGTHACLRDLDVERVLAAAGGQPTGET
jgi:heptosyltransferase II